MDIQLGTEICNLCLTLQTYISNSMYDICSKLPKINMSNTNIWFSHPLLITCFSLSTSHFCKWQHNSSSWVKSKLQELSLAPILFLTLLIEYLIRFYFLQIEYIHDIDLRFYSQHLYTTWRHACFFLKQCNYSCFSFVSLLPILQKAVIATF